MSAQLAMTSTRKRESIDRESAQQALAPASPCCEKTNVDVPGARFKNVSALDYVWAVTTWLDRYRLQRYRLDAMKSGGARVSLDHGEMYLDPLRRAFPPPSYWHGPYMAETGNYNQLLHNDRVDEDLLRGFLDMASSALLLPAVSLTELWAIAPHTEPDQEGKLVRSEVGRMLFDAKAYHDSAGQITHRGDLATAQRLGDLMAATFSNHPSVVRASRIIAVPANPPNQPYNLPDILAGRLAESLGTTPNQGTVIKSRPTPQVKELAGPDKTAALEGVFVLSERVDGETIVIVDDVLMSGATLGVIGSLLLEGGAACVIGLAATKTLRKQ